MTTKLKTSPCKGCGAPIVWAVMDGKRIPLDPRPAVYTVTGDIGDSKGETRCVRAVETDDGVSIAASMVSHFITCPNREQFTKKGPPGR